MEFTSVKNIKKKNYNYKHYSDEQEVATIRQRCNNSEQSTWKLHFNKLTCKCIVLVSGGTHIFPFVLKSGVI